MTKPAPIPLPAGVEAPNRSGHKKAPERKCIVTGKSGDSAVLVRFAISPDMVVVPDVEGKLPGRGIWVSATRADVEKAVKKGLFARAAKMQVKAPADLADQVKIVLEARVLALLGLGRKAGQLFAGHAKVEEATEKGHVVALFLASDAGAEGLRNARSLAAKAEAPVVTHFSAEQLGLALGRANVVHAALTAGSGRPKGRPRHRSRPGEEAESDNPRAPAVDKLSGLILSEVGRLQGFLTGA